MPAELDSPPRGSLRVLAAGEDEVELNRLARALEGPGPPRIELSVASGGGAVPRLVCAGGFDALILDQDLGSEEGIEVYRGLCAEGFDLPALLVTGLHDPDVLGRALEAGMSCVLLRDELDEPSVRVRVVDAIREHAAERCEPGAADLRALLAVALARCEPSRARLGLRIRADLGRTRALVRCDPSRLLKHLDGLISLALRRAGPGGPASVTLCAAAEDGAARIVLRPHPGAIAERVSRSVLGLWGGTAESAGERGEELALSLIALLPVPRRGN